MLVYTALHDEGDPDPNLLPSSVNAFLIKMGALPQLFEAENSM
jgi:hypothetical protein